MKLIEREEYFAMLEHRFQQSKNSEGHCVFLSGEAGIGKTMLTRSFCRSKEDESDIFYGTCDALFTPRPLAPLYDIAGQMNSGLLQNNLAITDRSGLFSQFLHELANREKHSLIVFEDIHWADEATIDFIKFLARRIFHIRCLFILSYRDDELTAMHPLRNLLGQLTPGSFTRMKLAPLSRKAVDQLAADKGYSGENVFGVSGGNPFYVQEILANYSQGIPENIRDSILSVYQRQADETKKSWQLLSVMPSGLEETCLDAMDPSFRMSNEDPFASGILVRADGIIRFKHELYRRTIESSLSPLLRITLNKKVLEAMLPLFEKTQAIERIVHHAKNGHDYDVVLQYAPPAAKKAAGLGAHIEAGKLYLSTIEYYQGNDKKWLAALFEAYAYECFLTNEMQEAIIYTRKALTIRKQQNEMEAVANCLRFLSRLWWYETNHAQAEACAVQAVEALAGEPVSRIKGMVFSNMSHLRMLAGITDEALYWGEQAKEIALALDDQNLLSHVLNNMGTVLMWIPASREQGILLLQESLEIAVRNGYHEHTARAYTNLGNVGMDIKDYSFATKMVDDGIQYCEDRELYVLMSCLISCKARLLLETGCWQESRAIAEEMIRRQHMVPISRIEVLVMVAKIKLRTGEEGVLPLLEEAKTKAYGIRELEYMIPAVCALLEYEWLTGKTCMEEAEIQEIISMAGSMGNLYKNSELAYWLKKAGRQRLELNESYIGYRMHNKKAAAEAAIEWERLGCPYEEALALFDSSEEGQKRAVAIMQALGAVAVYEKMKQQLKVAGVRGIPRGRHKTTQANAAQLTGREMEVLQLLHEGLQNKEIAERLFISMKTVDHHISSILYKLEVNSRGKAVLEAAKLGMLP